MTGRSPTLLTVGFIGLGVMGRPMALRIVAAGFPLLLEAAQPV